MRAFVITILGILLGLFTSITNILWLVALSAIVALIGAYLQYKDARPFECFFTEGIWVHANAEYRMTILRKIHKKNSPIVSLFVEEQGEFKEVIADTAVNANGDVILAAGIPFSGKIVIK